MQTSSTGRPPTRATPTNPPTTNQLPTAPHSFRLFSAPLHSLFEPHCVHNSLSMCLHADAFLLLIMQVLLDASGGAGNLQGQQGQQPRTWMGTWGGGSVWHVREQRVGGRGGLVLVLLAVP